MIILLFNTPLWFIIIVNTIGCLKFETTTCPPNASQITTKPAVITAHNVHKIVTNNTILSSIQQSQLLPCVTLTK